MNELNMQMLREQKKKKAPWRPLSEIVVGKNKFNSTKAVLINLKHLRNETALSDSI